MNHGLSSERPSLLNLLAIYLASVPVSPCFSSNMHMACQPETQGLSTATRCADVPVRTVSATILPGDSRKKNEGPSDFVDEHYPKHLISAIFSLVNAKYGIDLLDHKAGRLIGGPKEAAGW